MEVLAKSEFERIVLEDLPLIDVRAPVEFAEGAFPGSINLPLMDDEERRQVGICYKQKGHDAAVKLGHQLVSGQTRRERTEAWCRQIESRPETLLYCFRGGERSRIAQSWIFEATGKKICRLEGGYKAFRRYLINQLDPAQLPAKPLVLGGRTGTGKTLLLNTLEHAVDLEGIARHRGSAFGRLPEGQPTPINFENTLAWALVKHRKKAWKSLIVEDEGRNIGRCFLPKPLVEHFAQADLVVLERPLHERVEIIFDEYILAAQKAYLRVNPLDGILLWKDALMDSISRIRKRLGGARHQELEKIFLDAVESEDPEKHKIWILWLLREYYDPMYDYQLKHKQRHLVFKGNEQEVREYLSLLK
jgi:tRNA 2-selenouridine synthase